MAAFGGPGGPVFTGRNKRGQDTKHGFLSPLDSPYLPFKPLSKAFAAKRGYGGSVPGVVSLMGRCKALNLLCVICRA